MKIEELRNFIERRMRMSHAYQPLVIRCLLEAGGLSTVRQLARAFAAADEAQVAFYERRIRRMPIPVLKRHGVVEVDGDVVRLNVSKLSFEERVSLEAGCNARLAAFLKSRGISAWSGALELSPVADSIRYQVLKRDRVCRLCGAGPDDAPLEVDHILPRSKGGSNDLTNLQTLCRPCNQGKSNLDDEAF